MFDVQIWHIIGNLLWLLLESAKKNAKKLVNSNYKEKCLQKSPKKDKIYIFEKPLNMPFQICKNICKILNNLMCNYEKLKLYKFLLMVCVQIICKKFFAKLLESVSLWHRLSKKANIIKIWQPKMGQKQRFSLLQEKVIHAVCIRIQAVSIKAQF